MSLKEVCRVCLCTDRTLCSLVESILPKFDSPPDSVMDQWNIFSKMLIVPEGIFPDKICMECVYEIQRTYSFIIKCGRSEDILKKMKNGGICLERLKKISDLHKQNSCKSIESENDMRKNILKIKRENIERYENEDIEEDIDWIQFEVKKQDNDDREVHPELQDTSMVQHEDDNFEIDLSDHLECKKDVRLDKVSATQDIKHEPELDINMECNESDEIESENKSGTEILQCPSPACSFDCEIMDILKRHIIEKHIDGQTCKVCQKEFKCTAIGHCSTHLLTSRKLYKCKICSKIFKWKYTLKSHLIIHTRERPFKCEICSKTFRQKSNLTDHFKCHKVDRPFKCEICPKTFIRNSNLAEHLKCHRGEKPYKCEICPKTYGHKNNLMDHIRCHTGERPFKCKICLKTYRHKTSLTDHLRHHTGERPFKCEICAKTFVQKSNLTSHLICHTVERPFKCETCRKTFMRKSNLTEHLKCHKE